MNSLLTKTYTAAAAIAASRFVKHGSADYAAIQATDASAAILGVSAPNIAVPQGKSVDVIKEGLAYLELGDSVTRGNILIADANGKGIPAAIVAGEEQHAGAIAEISGVSGDIIPVHVIAGTVIATDTSIVQVDVVVSSAELLALHATPKELVPAPGPGKAIIVEDVLLQLDYNGTAYDGIAEGEDLEVRYVDGSGELVATIETSGGFLDSDSSVSAHVRPTTTGPLIGAIENAALVICLTSGEIATGNSPLKVRVRYRTVDWQTALT